MNVPGFSAETSLYTTSGVYGLSVAAAARQEVVPQAPLGSWPDWKVNCTYGICQPILYCVDPLGCKVVGHRRQHCCYLHGIPLGCNWVSC